LIPVQRRPVTRTRGIGYVACRHLGPRYRGDASHTAIPGRARNRRVLRTPKRSWSGRSTTSPGASSEPGAHVERERPATPGGVSTADRRGDERRLLQPHDGGDLLFGRFGDGARDLAEAILDETAITVLRDDLVAAANCIPGTWTRVPSSVGARACSGAWRTSRARALKAVNACDARRSSPRSVRDGQEQQRSQYWTRGWGASRAQER
jgi:hypothetical protein